MNDVLAPNVGVDVVGAMKKENHCMKQDCAKHVSSPHCIPTHTSFLTAGDAVAA